METLKHIITVNGTHGNKIAVYNNNIIIDEIFYIGEQHVKHLIMQLNSVNNPKLFKFTFNKKSKLDAEEYEKEQIKLEYSSIESLEVVDYPFERYAIISYRINETNELFTFATSNLKKEQLNQLVTTILEKTNLTSKIIENPNDFLKKDFKWNSMVFLSPYGVIYITFSFIIKYSNYDNLLILFNILFAILFSPVLYLFLKSVYYLRKKICHFVYFKG